MRSDPTEWVTASTDVLVLAFKADQFVSLIKTSEKFSDYFENLTSIHESFKVADLYQIKSPILVTNQEKICLINVAARK